MVDHIRLKIDNWSEWLTFIIIVIIIIITTFLFKFDTYREYVRENFCLKCSCFNNKLLSSSF